jgi:hypothetical protein
MECEELIEININDELNVKNESDLFEAIIKWVEVDFKARKKVTLLLSSVYFCILII